MAAITPEMLREMRAIIEDELLPDTAQIITITQVPNGQGGFTESRGTSSAYPFRLDITQGYERVSGGALQSFTSYKGSLPYDTIIAATQQLLHNGVTYAVTGGNVNQSWIAVRRVDLEKL